MSVHLSVCMCCVCVCMCVCVCVCVCVAGQFVCSFFCIDFITLCILYKLTIRNKLSLICPNKEKGVHTQTHTHTHTHTHTQAWTLTAYGSCVYCKPNYKKLYGDIIYIGTSVLEVISYTTLNSYYLLSVSFTVTVLVGCCSISKLET